MRPAGVTVEAHCPSGERGRATSQVGAAGRTLLTDPELLCGKPPSARGAGGRGRNVGEGWGCPCFSVSQAQAPPTLSWGPEATKCMATPRTQQAWFGEQEEGGWPWIKGHLGHVACLNTGRVGTQEIGQARDHSPEPSASVCAVGVGLLRDGTAAQGARLGVGAADAEAVGGAGGHWGCGSEFGASSPSPVCQRGPCHHHTQERQATRHLEEAEGWDRSGRGS